MQLHKKKQVIIQIIKNIEKRPHINSLRYFMRKCLRNCLGAVDTLLPGLGWCEARAGAGTGAGRTGLLRL